MGEKILKLKTIAGKNEATKKLTMKSSKKKTGQKNPKMKYKQLKSF